MKRPIRLWGKKRGHRISGWWIIGRVSEAAFFGALMLLGVAALTLVIGWQLISPETNVYSVGYGFWLLILVSISFVGIGGLGFGYQVLTAAITDEHRAALTQRSFARAADGLAIPRKLEDYLPRLNRFTDSPGVHLRFRLPETNRQTHQILFAAMLVLIWDVFVMVLATLVIGKFLLGQPPWFGVVIVCGFTYVAVRLTRRFFVQLFFVTRIGPTVVEIDHLPLYPGGQTRMLVVQHGRMSIKNLSVSLVCEERVTYHFGTDIRTESQETSRLVLLERSRIRIQDGSPLRLECELQLPPQAMHSFVSPHNAIAWKLIVEGDISRWPSFCRSFPVAVYPAPMKAAKQVAQS